MQDFDPTENLANNFRLVLIVKEDRVEKFMDDEQAASTPWRSLAGIVKRCSSPMIPSFDHETGHRRGPSWICPDESHAPMHQSLYRDRHSRAARAKAGSFADRSSHLRLPGCRWVSALPFHLTLAFLGDVPD